MQRVGTSEPCKNVFQWKVETIILSFIKGSVREKWKGVYAYGKKLSMVIATNP